MKIFFVNIAVGLDINLDILMMSSRSLNTTPSVAKIRQKFIANVNFSFETVTEDIVRKKVWI